MLGVTTHHSVISWCGVFGVFGWIVSCLLEDALPFYCSFQLFDSDPFCVHLCCRCRAGGQKLIN